MTRRTNAAATDTTYSDAVNRLHPNITHVWRFSGLLGAAFSTGGIGALELWVLNPGGLGLFPPGALTATVGLAGFAHALAWPSVRYRYWRWTIDDERVLIQKGVIWRSRSLIPRVRVQHVDTRTSPLQRWFGLASLIVYTAGTRGADAEIPGLTAEEAERLREELARVEELDERT
ncbi:MAG: PH domain-containing protein [Gemmatimonadales bacterium]